MNIEELCEKLKELEETGLGIVEIEDRPKDSGSIGRHLEAAVGIVENNRRGPDCQKAEVELKTKKKGSTARTSLLCAEPTWIHPEIKDIRDAVAKYKNETGRMNIVVTARKNIHGFWIEVDDTQIIMYHDGVVLCYWDKATLLQRANEKLVNMALTCVEDEVNVSRSDLYEGFKENEFLNLLSSGKMKVEFRAADYNGVKKFKNRGTAFRLLPTHIKTLYNTTRTV
jgi:hypothetical protein